MTKKLVQTVQGLLERDVNPNETMRQLLHFGNGRILSWGMTTRTNFQNKGLLLKVSGHHHKGYVLIVLGWDDVYKFYLISTHGVLKQSVEGVYFDELFDKIDEKIEKIPEYTH
jgi:hypothetical protein